MLKKPQTDREADYPVEHPRTTLRLRVVYRRAADTTGTTGANLFTTEPQGTTVRTMNVLSSQILAQFFSDHLYWVFLALIVLNVTQRRHRTASKKRMATMYLAIAMLVVHTASNLTLAYDGSDLHVFAVLLLTVAVVAYFRDHAFPFTVRCRASGRFLDAHTVLYRDSNILPEFDKPAEDPAAQEENAEGSKADADSD